MSSNEGDRHAVRRAAEANATVCLEQATAIDVFVRESDALFTVGVSRDDVINRATIRMGLEFEEARSTADALLFAITRSSEYGKLVVHMLDQRSYRYELVPL
jgi:hypothetical protein